MLRIMVFVKMAQCSAQGVRFEISPLSRKSLRVQVCMALAAFSWSVKVLPFLIAKNEGNL